MYKRTFVLVVAATAALLISQSSLAVGQSSCSRSGDVRLVGGSGPHEGRVEICRYTGYWSTVCDSSWSSSDARVLCRQLGFSDNGAIARSNAYFGQGTGSIYYTGFACNGRETRILSCSHRSPRWYDYCYHSRDAGVTCRPETTIRSIVERNITADIDTDIEAVRLINGEENVNSGRLEVLYNGTWGTVCNDFWSYSDAKVACRMFGYDDAACAVTTTRFGAAVSSVPFWMDNVQCSGSEEALDRCSFRGWGSHNCYHYSDDAGVVCVNTSEIGAPYDLELVDSRTTLLTINFTAPQLPSIVQGLRYYVLYQAPGRFYRAIFIYPSPANTTMLSFTLRSLTRDTEYTVQVRAEMQYTHCSGYIYGNYSDPVIFRTNATRRTSMIPFRLVSPYPGVDFLGRVEVRYNGQWGTVCDNSFSTPEANLVCQSLNFTRALCTVSNARFGRGSGRIWLNYLDCSSGSEIVEDCTHRGWGSSTCSHSEDVGVVCRPSGLPLVKNLTIVSVAHTSITVRWIRHSFPRGASTTRLQLRYQRQGLSFGSTLTLSSSSTQYTLRGLQFDAQYNISIRSYMTYRYCYTNIYGDYSNQVSAITVETAPTGPPTRFNIEAINSTAIEASWSLPSSSVRNGFIRGYRLFVLNGSRVIRNITIPDNTTRAYDVGGLQPATAYTFSVLAYTVADGPRSIHLTAVTLLHDPLIVGFGIYGNGLGTVTRYTYNYGFDVHCTTSNEPTITNTDWFFANGSKVGLVSPNFREGHYGNGTTVLQIGLNRRLRYCDGGNYTCVVNTTSGRTNSRSFHLRIGSSPPTPSRPTIVELKSTSVTIEWSESSCNGGHIPTSYTIRYGRSSYYSYSYIYTSQTRYKITGLSHSTSYQFYIRTSGTTGSSSYSSARTVTTLPRAPSAPRDVRVKQIRPMLVQVSWRRPAVSYTTITHYTVYAIPQVSYEATRSKRQTTTTTPQTIRKIFPGTATSGNVSLIEHSITYQFQVSASTISGQTPNEGELSTISANTTIFIPMPGLPTPQNVRTTPLSTSSIAVAWDYPPPPFEPIQSFLVTYSGEVEWRSPGDYLVRFEDTGEVSVTMGTSVRVSNLIPTTSYQFKVSAITSDERGAEISSFAATRPSPQAERLAHFQLRLKPVFNCLDFMNSNTNVTDRLLKFRTAIVEEFSTQVCTNCRLTTANIRKDEFSCRGGLTNQIVYRAMIVGTSVRSAPALVSLIESWVASGRASITVFSSRLHLDRNCDTRLDNLMDPDCPLVRGKVTTKPDEIRETKPTAKPIIVARTVNSGEIGGFVIGGIIVLLLAVLILVIVIIALKKYKSRKDKYMPHDRMIDASFHDIGGTKENIQFDIADTKEDLGK